MPLFLFVTDKDHTAKAIKKRAHSAPEKVKYPFNKIPTVPQKSILRKYKAIIEGPKRVILLVYSPKLDVGSVHNDRAQVSPNWISARGKFCEQTRAPESEIFTILHG